MLLATMIELLSLLIHLSVPEFIPDKSGIQIFATPNPVYINEDVTLDCQFGQRLSLFSAEITAYSGDESKGHLNYTCANGGAVNSTIIGLVYQRSVTSCSSPGLTGFSFTFSARQALSMDIYCTAILLNSTISIMATLYSSAISLIILASPPWPSLSYSPSYYQYDEGLNVTLSCTSYPTSLPATLALDVTSRFTGEILENVTGLNSVSISWIMSLRYHGTVATCSVTNYAYAYLRTALADTRYYWMRGYNLLRFSSNPVFLGDIVTISCHASYFQFFYLFYPSIMKIEAFQGIEQRGFTIYGNYGQRNASGIFDGLRLDISINRYLELITASVSLVASSYMELDYYCTTVEYYSNQVVSVTPANRLTVKSLPSPPTLLPAYLVFIDGANVNITCYTFIGGNPTVQLQMLVKSSNLQHQKNSTVGLASTSIIFSASPIWHRANVVCSALNYNRPAMNTIGIVKIVHLAITGSPDVAYISDNDTLLKCQDYISGFPEPTFKWTTPTQSNVSDIVALNNSYFVVRPRQTGLFNCSAKNEITGKTVTVAFHVTEVDKDEVATSYQATIGGAAGSLIAAAAIVGLIVVMLRKRPSYLKTRSCLSVFQMKQQEEPTTYGNDYSQTPAGLHADVDEDAAANTISTISDYGHLRDCRVDSEASYSTLERTYQNSAYFGQ